MLQNAFLMGDFLYKNEVSDNFPWWVYYNKSCQHMKHTHLFQQHQSIKKTKMMFYTFEKFLSQQTTFNTFLFQFRNCRFWYVFIFDESLKRFVFDSLQHRVVSMK